MENAAAEATSSPDSTAYTEPHSTTASLEDANGNADTSTMADSVGLSKDEPGDSTSSPTEDGEDGAAGDSEARVTNVGPDSVASATAPSSSVSCKEDVGDETPSAWTLWYLRKDLEWRRRAQREHEARKAALREAQAAAERKAKQRSQAESAFAAWCAMKRELDAARRAQERRRRAEADADRKKTELRTCALSEKKCREWLARKQVELRRASQHESSSAKNKPAPTNGHEKKAAANQSAFKAWLAGKNAMPPTEKFHVDCIDGQLFAVWR